MSATHMKTPIGKIPIRTEIIKEMLKKSDREIAEQALNSSSFIDPEYYAELCARGLSGPGMKKKDTYALINAKEKSYKA